MKFKYIRFSEEHYTHGYTSTQLIALAFGSLVSDTGAPITYVLFNPADFHFFTSLNPDFIFDRETQRKLIQTGIVGYLWGATIVLEEDIDANTVVVTTDMRERLFPETSYQIQLTIWDKLSPHAPKLAIPPPIEIRTKKVKA